MNNPPRRQPDSRESGVVQRLRNSIRKIGLPVPHVLLACSGGKDSVALACSLHELVRLDLVSLTLVHIHHGQHDRADQAAKAVSDIGTTIGVPVRVRHLDSQAIAKHSGLGTEEALRRERYVALADIATDVSADCIALAHHQTDQAESLLLHLLRGAGVEGLAGMSVWESRRVPWWDYLDAPVFRLWRPFLHESAATVADIGLRSGLPIVEDPTNSDTSFRRNAIRHDVLPVLERIAPGSMAAIARSGEIVATDAALLAGVTQGLLAACMTEGGLDRATLMTLPEGWRSRVVRAWLMQADIVAEVTRNRVEAIVAMAMRNHGGSRIQIGTGTEVVLMDGVLSIESWQNRNN